MGELFTEIPRRTTAKVLLFRALALAAASEAGLATGLLGLPSSWVATLPDRVLGMVALAIPVIAVGLALLLVHERHVERRLTARGAPLPLDESVRRRREGFVTLSAGSSDFVLVRARDGSPLHINAAVEAALRYAPEELSAASPFAAVDLADVTRVERFYLDVVLKQAGLSEPIQFRYRGGDGTVHEVQSVFNNLLDDPAVVAVVEFAHDVGEQKRLEGELLRVSYSDRLTALPNQALFMERLEGAVAASSHQPMALLVIDIDRFKLVNDGLGRSAGDDLLLAVAQRLEGCVRAEDLLGRLGGDEFALLLTGRNPAVDAARVAERIQQRLLEPINVAGHDVFASVSIGAVCDAAAEVPAEELLRRAYVALDEAKHAGGARWLGYGPEVEDHRAEALALHADLRRALQEQQFQLLFHPEVDLRSGAIVGAEALLRWQHPSRGLLLPEQFLPTAEAGGFGVPLGRWLLVEACRQAAGWPRASGTPGTAVRLDLPARELDSPSLVDDVATVLHTSGLDPALLCLEVADSAVIDDVESAGRVMRAVQRLGVRFAIGAFGSGYGSLNSLRRLPFNTLNVDAAFVHDLDHDGRTGAIAAATVAMAHALGMDVVASGIEDAHQLARLQRMGCDRGQGDYFATAVASAELEPLITAGVTGIGPEHERSA